MFYTKTHLDTCEYGVGVFASEDISKGSFIYRSEPITKIVIGYADDGTHSGQQILKYSYKMNGTIYLCLDDGRFFNHSKTPNVIFDEAVDADIAARDIKQGEQLFVDYHSFCDEDDYNIKLLKELRL